MSDSFNIEERDGLPCLHVIVDRSLLFKDEHGDLGMFDIYFPLDDIQAYFRQHNFKAQETLDLAYAVMQRATLALGATNTAIESDWPSLLSSGLEEIIDLCQAQFPQVQAEEKRNG